MSHALVSGVQRQRAKQLRRRMTRAEALLWRYLKAHRINGLVFRRQTPIGNYVADFVCHSQKLIVELDGESHDFVSRQQHDKKRDAWFEARGFKVLRFANDDVLRNLEGVVEHIRQISAVPPSLTLPRKGGGNDDGASK